MSSPPDGAILAATVTVVSFINYAKEDVSHISHSDIRADFSRLLIDGGSELRSSRGVL